jgi:CubicO group peptidase (beta-lactamase class C family)
MKYRYLFIVVLFLQQITFSQTVNTRIDELLQKYNNFKLFNGTVLVADESGVLFKKGYGFADMEWNIPNEPDVKFRIGSVTKQFTAMIIMQLVEEGKIDLNGKITDYLDYYRKDTGDKVTIHQLLIHTSGIPSYTGKEDFGQKTSRLYYTPEDFIKEQCMGDFDFEPGTQWAYNNSGYFILGAIIEEITGKTYAAAMQERIFDPLQMTSSGYDFSESIIEKRASGYERNGSAFSNAVFVEMALPYSAGSLYSTVEDLYKWDRALYTETLLSEKLKEKYFYPHYEAMGGHYAYGWAVIKDKNLSDKEVTVVSHGGGINGFNSLIMRIPEEKKLVVLLNNTGGTLLVEMANSIVKILNNKEYPDPRKPVSLHIDEVVKSKGIDEAVKEYRQIKKEETGKFIFRESELNSLGYSYLRNNQIDEAIAIFRLNVEAYPDGSNTYDSLGEALLAKGNKEESIENYKKSLELNPRNANAVKVLKSLGVETEEKKDITVSPEVLKKYEGKYQLTKDLIITISTEEGKIYAQATGQPKFELYPETETKYYLKVVEAQMEFDVNENNTVTGLTLFQNGQKMPAPKI